MVKDDSSDHITFLHCSVVHCLCSSHHWTHKRALPGVMSGLCTATRLWYPAVWSSPQTALMKLAAHVPDWNLQSIILQSALLLCLSLQINARISRSWSIRFCPLSAGFRHKLNKLQLRASQSAGASKNVRRRVKMCEWGRKNWYLGVGNHHDEKSPWSHQIAK